LGLFVHQELHLKATPPVSWYDSVYLDNGEGGVDPIVRS
jgi:hypothetical protein